MRIRFEDQSQQCVVQINEEGVAPLVGDKICMNVHGNIKYYDVVERIFKYDVLVDATNAVVNDWHLFVTIKLSE